jgi:hypothetical protein
MKTDDIIELAEAFSEHSSLTISTVSTYAANDGKWLGGLKKNASCTLRKAEIVVRWFSNNWPADLEWPADIPRPKTSKEEAA